MPEYKITAVQRRDEWQSQYGPMVAYDLSLEGEDGWIRINQKPDTPPPRENQTITGNITTVNMRDGESFRKIQKVSPEYANRGQQQHRGGGSQESYIVQMLEELTGRRPVSDTVHSVDGDKKPPELDIPF